MLNSKISFGIRLLKHFFQNFSSISFLSRFIERFSATYSPLLIAPFSVASTAFCTALLGLNEVWHSWIRTHLLLNYSFSCSFLYWAQNWICIPKGPWLWMDWSITLHHLLIDIVEIFIDFMFSGWRSDRQFWSNQIRNLSMRMEWISIENAKIVAHIANAIAKPSLYSRVYEHPMHKGIKQKGIIYYLKIKKALIINR